VVKNVNVPAGDDGVSVPQEILEAFVWEVDDLLSAAEQEFVLWENIVGDLERLTTLFRTLHRLTGNFSFYHYADLVSLSKAMESVLDRYLQGEVFQGEYPEEVFLKVIDAMRDAVASIARFSYEKVENRDELIDSLQDIMRMPLGEIFVHAGLVGVETVEHALRVQENARAQSEQPRRLGEVLVAMGEVTPDQLAEALAEQDKSGESKPAGTGEKRAASGNDLQVVDEVLSRKDVCVDRERLFHLQELVAGLHNKVQKDKDAVSGAWHEAFAELLEVSVSLSKVPAASLLPRMNRLVHDLALNNDKQVQFKVIGEELELERGVLKRLNDPLVHLLRNSIAHGIETPGERKDCGKTLPGQLTLSFLRHGDEIWAGVEDDGAGLDLEKILARGIRHGLIDLGVSGLSSREIASLIFELGFTTADKVTDSSGRGVGMDMVKKSLNQLGGRVDVFSLPGKGTRVTLRIPDL
jgi:two-component system chemotaxis sensor kinase CheA